MKKRVLIAAPNFQTIGGLEVFCQNVAYGLTSRGWDVHLLSTHVKPVLRPDLKDEVRLYDLSNVRSSCRKVYEMSKIVNSCKPDILFLNHCATGQYSLPLISPRVHPVSVLHSQDDRFYRVASIFRDRVEQWIAPSPALASDFERWVTTEQKHKIRVLPHGVESMRARQLGAPRRPQIAFAGYIAENKGADLLPKILSAVAKEFPDVILQVAGYGPLVGVLVDQCKTLGVSNNLVMRGVLDQNDMTHLLNESAVFLLPTRVEGFCLAAAEAMMAGAVPVVTRIQGVTDSLIKEGLSGFLVQQDNVKVFVDAILQLLKNNELFIRLSLAAHARAVKDFSLNVMLDRYERIFEVLTASPDSNTNPRRNYLGWILESAREASRCESGKKRVCRNLVRKIFKAF